MEMEGLYYTVDCAIVPLSGRHERNHSQSYRAYQSPPERVDTHIETLKELFQMFQSEYGRCVNNVWRDTKDGAEKVGWVFEKREKYEDSKQYYISETWVSLHRKCIHCNGGFHHTPIVKKPFNPEQE